MKHGLCPLLRVPKIHRRERERWLTQRERERERESFKLNCNPKKQSFMKISFSTHGLEYMNVWRSFITNKYFYAIISILKPKKDWYHIFLFLDLAVVDVPFFLSTYFLIKIPVCFIVYFVMEATSDTCLAFIYIFTLSC